jgi:hypothetical protein
LKGKIFNAKNEIETLKLKLTEKESNIENQSKTIENIFNHLKVWNSTDSVQVKSLKCENSFHEYLSQFVFLLVCVITMLNVALFINLKRRMEKPKMNRRWDKNDAKEMGTIV